MYVYNVYITTVPGVRNAVCCQTEHAIYLAATTTFFSRHFSDVSNMNEGNSAGGGHEGLSPAPPAVSDRVTLQSTEKSVTTPKSTAASTITSHNNKTTTTTAVTTQHLKTTSKQQQQQLLSAQLPVPLSNLSTEATAAAPTPAAAASTTYSSTSEISDSTVVPPQAKRQRLDNTETVDEQLISTSSSSNNNSSNIVGAVSSNIVGSLLPASVVASSEVGGANSSGLQDLNVLRKRILQQKYQNLRHLKERYVYHAISSLIGGNHSPHNVLQFADILKMCPNTFIYKTVAV